MWILIMLLLAAPVIACNKGCTEYEGNCACDQAPEKAVQTFVPSEDKPSHHPQAAWERGEVKADTPPSLAASDAKLDQERAKADAEGKKDAGLKTN